MNHSAEQRAVQRISLEVPIMVGDTSGTTRNISGNGIYFVTEEPFSADENIQFSLALDYVVPGKLLQFACQGRVVRVESLGEQYGIAARIDRYCCLH